MPLTSAGSLSLQEKGTVVPRKNRLTTNTKQFLHTVIRSICPLKPHRHLCCIFLGNVQILRY